MIVLEVEFHCMMASLNHGSCKIIRQKEKINVWRCWHSWSLNSCLCVQVRGFGLAFLLDPKPLQKKKKMSTYSLGLTFIWDPTRSSMIRWTQVNLAIRYDSNHIIHHLSVCFMYFRADRNIALAFLSGVHLDRIISSYTAGTWNQTTQPMLKYTKHPSDTAII